MKINISTNIEIGISLYGTPFDKNSHFSNRWKLAFWAVLKRPGGYFRYIITQTISPAMKKGSRLGLYGLIEALRHV